MSTVTTDDLERCLDELLAADVLQRRVFAPLLRQFDSERLVAIEKLYRLLQQLDMERPDLALPLMVALLPVVAKTQLHEVWNGISLHLAAAADELGRVRALKIANSRDYAGAARRLVVAALNQSQALQ